MRFIRIIKTTISIHQARSDALARAQLLSASMARMIYPLAAANAPGKKGKSLHLGFVPLNDSAPLIMANELGLFAKYDLQVQLSRELGWATVRDKIIYGELDAAHALAAMPVATSFGLGSIRCETLTALVLNLNGNAITLSNDLWKRGVR